MTAAARKPEHVIYGAVHDPRHEWWKIPCRCGRCGQVVTLTIDDEDLAAGGVPTERDALRLLDRHCGYWAAQHRDDRLERGVSDLRAVWATMRLNEQYQLLAQFRRYVDWSLKLLGAAMGLPPELLDEAATSPEKSRAQA